jgi:hypothetical protein
MSANHEPQFGSTKEINQRYDKKTARSVLNQLVDVIQEDISGSATRKSYQMFVTGGVGPGVTSSLYQTVYDQDFTLQTANPILDMTVGLYQAGDPVTGSLTQTLDSGKMLFPSQSLMMREKIDIYKQYASALLGDSNAFFATPFGSVETNDQVDSACFVSFKRLFSRDKIKRETFALKMYPQPAGNDSNSVADEKYFLSTPNISSTATGSAKIFTDFGSSNHRRRTFGGEVGNLVDSSDSSKHVGLIFYDAGIAVLNLGGKGATNALRTRAVDPDARISGSISAMVAGVQLTDDSPLGKQIMGKSALTEAAVADQWELLPKFIPDLMVSASVDEIVDHLATTRFSSGSLTATTFQNNTNINSNLIFCRATADEFNYSSNPSYTKDNRIVVIENGQESVQRSFSYITTVGLYDANDTLLAVAKLSRPIEKNDERDLTIRVRLDF